MGTSLSFRSQRWCSQAGRGALQQQQQPASDPFSHEDGDPVPSILSRVLGWSTLHSEQSRCVFHNYRKQQQEVPCSECANKLAYKLSESCKKRLLSENRLIMVSWNNAKASL